ncbi:MAG: hypothetical protein ACLRRT_08685 [Ruthenibacterium lactatiformans]
MHRAYHGHFLHRHGLVANAHRIGLFFIIPNLVAGMVANGEATYGQRLARWQFPASSFADLFSNCATFCTEPAKNIRLASAAQWACCCQHWPEYQRPGRCGDGSFINFSDKSVQLGLISLAIALLLTTSQITVNGRL